MSTSNRIKLLLLEDDHIDVKLINDIVRSAKTFHYEIHHVDDLLKAEELLRKFPFDVVLLDVSLPPGQDLAEAISHINRVSPATPIVALDNEFNEALAARTAQLGVQDYACKLDLNAHVFERIMRYAIERNKFIYSLKLSEEREKNLLHAAGEGILGIDENGDCTFINPAALAILGYRHEDDLLGKHLHSIIHHTRPDGTHCPDHLCAIYQAFRQSKPIHVEDDVFWRADGSSVSVDYRSVPLEYGGHCHGSVVTFSDITERKQILSDLMSAQAYPAQRVKERP
ncbi:MAG: response regulator, partial [Gammaproteobacteria bacterium]